MNGISDSTAATWLAETIERMKLSGVSDQQLGCLLIAHAYLHIFHKLENIFESADHDYIIVCATDWIARDFRTEIRDLLRIESSHAAARLTPTPPGQDMLNIMAGRSPDDNGDKSQTPQHPDDTPL